MKSLPLHPKNSKTMTSFIKEKAEDYDDEAGQPKAGRTPVRSGETGTNGILYLGQLDLGEYRLVETAAPDGYEASDSAIKIIVAATGVTAMQGSGVSE